MLIGRWWGFSGRTAGHNCWTVIINLASLAALLDVLPRVARRSWKSGLASGGPGELSCSGKSKWTVALALPWMAAIIKVLNSHCLKQTERHFSVCSCLRHCSVGWLFPWPADQHDTDGSTCSMPISCNQAKVDCSRNNAATDSRAWYSPGLQ